MFRVCGIFDSLDNKGSLVFVNILGSLDCQNVAILKRHRRTKLRGIHPASNLQLPQILSQLPAELVVPKLGKKVTIYIKFPSPQHIELRCTATSPPFAIPSPFLVQIFPHLVPRSTLNNHQDSSFTGNADHVQ